MDPHNLKKAKTAAAESGIPIEFVREIGAPAVELIVQAGEDTDIGASRSVVSPTFQET